MGPTSPAPRPLQTLRIPSEVTPLRNHVFEFTIPGQLFLFAPPPGVRRTSSALGDQTLSPINCPACIFKDCPVLCLDPSETTSTGDFLPSLVRVLFCIFRDILLPLLRLVKATPILACRRHSSYTTEYHRQD